MCVQLHGAARDFSPTQLSVQTLVLQPPCATTTATKKESIPWCGKGFVFQTELSVQTYLSVHMVIAPMCKQMPKKKKSSTPWCGKGFFSHSASSADSCLTVFHVAPMCKQMHNICTYVKNPRRWQPYHCSDRRKYCMCW